MQTKILLVVVAAVAFVGGFFLGRWHTATSWNRFFEQYVYLRNADDIQRFTRALTYFRDGKQDDALLVLETHLDSLIIMFVAYDRVSPAQRGEFVPRAMAVAREYRSQHPWKSSSGEKAEIVRKVLETVK